MEIRKVFKTGNSYAVSIPADVVRELNLEDQHLEVIRGQNGEIILRPIAKSVEQEITPEFTKLVDDFMKEYSDTLKGLSKR